MRKDASAITRKERTQVSIQKRKRERKKYTMKEGRHKEVYKERVKDTRSYMRKDRNIPERIEGRKDETKENINKKARKDKWKKGHDVQAENKVRSL